MEKDSSIELDCISNYKSRYVSLCDPLCRWHPHCYWQISWKLSRNNCLSSQMPQRRNKNKTFKNFPCHRRNWIPWHPKQKPLYKYLKPKFKLTPPNLYNFKQMQVIFAAQAISSKKTQKKTKFFLHVHQELSQKQNKNLVSIKKN